jgi:hypothetical protein
MEWLVSPLCPPKGETGKREIKYSMSNKKIFNNHFSKIPPLGD